MVTRFEDILEIRDHKTAELVATASLQHPGRDLPWFVTIYDDETHEESRAQRARGPAHALSIVLQHFKAVIASRRTFS